MNLQVGASFVQIRDTHPWRQFQPSKRRCIADAAGAPQKAAAFAALPHPAEIPLLPQPEGFVHEPLTIHTTVAFLQPFL
jgi:hypothetical protein